MPYDISQLNDMLIPELIDVADELKIQNARSFDKQTLVYKILDQQASNIQPVEDDSKKRRGRKPKEDMAKPVADTLAEQTESVQLTEDQAKELDNMLKRQKEIIDSFKDFYLGLIEEQKKIRFNRATIIKNTIDAYRQFISEKTDAEFSKEVEKLRKDLCHKLPKEAYSFAHKRRDRNQ